MSKPASFWINKLSGFDYIRCTFPDMNGVARGKVLPCRTAPELLEEGVGVSVGECEKLNRVLFFQIHAQTLDHCHGKEMGYVP